MLTKLEAVNQMLDAIGEDPVSSLSSGLPDAATADRVLDRVSKKIQEAGWHTNTDFNYTIALETDGTIPITADILRIDTWGVDQFMNVTERVVGNVRLLYNVENRTTVFTKAPKLMIVRLFDFEDLTSALQMFIAAQAAVEFQAGELGSVALDSLIARDRDDAWVKLVDAELESEDANPLRDNPQLRWATFRNSPSRNGAL